MNETTTPIRWSRRSETTAGGAVILTDWTTRVGKFLLTVTNWTGSRTVSWSITIPGTDWITSGDEDRYEFTVTRLKATVIEKTAALAARNGF